jgi:hypothetical protein
VDRSLTQRWILPSAIKRVTNSPRIIPRHSGLREHKTKAIRSFVISLDFCEYSVEHDNNRPQRGYPVKVAGVN